MESIFIISIVIMGGGGSFCGPVLGAAVLAMLPEALRFVGMPSSIAANMRQIIYGAALVACAMWRPQGLSGKYPFGIFSGGRRTDGRNRKTDGGGREKNLGQACYCEDQIVRLNQFRFCGSF